MKNFPEKSMGALVIEAEVMAFVQLSRAQNDLTYLDLYFLRKAPNGIEPLGPLVCVIVVSKFPCAAPSQLPRCASPAPRRPQRATPPHSYIYI